MKMRILILLFILTPLYVHGQQPQTPDVTGIPPIYKANSKWVNGVAPGYWPTSAGGLTLNLSAGSVVCGGTVPVTYSAGTLTMTASATNYVQLNASSLCAPFANTSGFVAGNMPIAIVVTNASIASITDWRPIGTATQCTGCTTNTTIQNGLGNGTTVIDASLMPGADFSVKVNNALATSTCQNQGCYIETAGMTGAQTASVPMGPIGQGGSGQPVTLHLGAGLVLTEACGAYFELGEWSNIFGEGSRTLVYGTPGCDAPLMVPAPGAYRSMTVKDIEWLSQGNGTCLDFMYNGSGVTNVLVEDNGIFCATGVKFEAYYNRIIGNQFGASNLGAGPLYSGIQMDAVGGSVNSNALRDNAFSGLGGTGWFCRGGYANTFEGAYNAETVGLGIFDSCNATNIHDGYFEAVGLVGPWAANTVYGVGALVANPLGGYELAVNPAASNTVTTVAPNTPIAGEATLAGIGIVGCPQTYTYQQVIQTGSWVSYPSQNNGQFPIVSCNSTSIVIQNPNAVADTSVTADNVEMVSNPPGESGASTPAWCATQGCLTVEGPANNPITWMYYNDALVTSGPGYPAGHGIVLADGGQTATIDGAIGTQVMDLYAVVSGERRNRINTMGNLQWGSSGVAPYSVTANPLDGFVHNVGNDDPDDALDSWNGSGFGATGPWYGSQIDNPKHNCVGSGLCGHEKFRIGTLHTSSGQVNYGPVYNHALPTPSAPTLAVVGSDTSTPATYYLVAYCNGKPTVPSLGTTISGPATPSGSQYVTVTVPTTYPYVDPVYAGWTDQWSMCQWDVLKGSTIGAAVSLTNGPLRLNNRVYNDTSPTTHTATIPVRNATGDWVFDGQVNFTGGTVAASYCGTLSGAAGCVVVQVGGVTHYIPYW